MAFNHALQYAEFWSEKDVTYPRPMLAPDMHFSSVRIGKFTNSNDHRIHCPGCEHGDKWISNCPNAHFTLSGAPRLNCCQLKQYIDQNVCQFDVGIGKWVHWIYRNVQMPKPVRKENSEGFRAEPEQVKKLIETYDQRPYHGSLGLDPKVGPIELKPGSGILCLPDVAPINYLVIPPQRVGFDTNQYAEALISHLGRTIVREVMNVVFIKTEKF